MKKKKPKWDNLLVTFHVENEHVSENFVLAFFKTANSTDRRVTPVIMYMVLLNNRSIKSISIACSLRPK